MEICKECGVAKPDVQLGVCDDCFRYGPKPGAARASTSTGSSSPPRPIILTTSIDVPNRAIDQVISIVAAEAALGMNVFRDVANNWRDFFGGSSQSSQNALKEARTACLEKLKQEAAALGADAVIAVDLDYNQLATSGAGILFVAASGTAVTLKPVPAN